MRAAISVVLIALACSTAPPSAGQDPSLRVPAGFQVAVFADGLQGVRYLALGPGDAIYASQPASGLIVRLTDDNHDGRADSVVTIARGLHGPFGIAFRGDTMYVAEELDVLRFDPNASAPVTIISRIPSGGHSTRTILFGPDGKLYLSVGSSCNICDERDSLRAAVSQFNRDGSGGRLFARGLRNTVGMAFHPTTGELWGANNDRDNLGDDVPPEHVNIIKDGRFYGWPQCYLPGKTNPEYGSADCSGVEPPAISVQAHSAPLGLAFYTGTQFPAEYHGSAFVAYRGSWNRTVPTGYKVVVVRFRDGKPVSVEDFVTGWLEGASAWGRPVDVITGRDGALYVSDQGAGRIYRISHRS